MRPSRTYKKFKRERIIIMVFVIDKKKKNKNKKNVIKIRKVVADGSDFFSKETTTKVTLMSLKLALEPLFFFALKFLQNGSLNISSFCGIYFAITTATILRTLDSGTNIFCKGALLSELETIIGTSTAVSDLSFCNNTCSCP